MLGCLTILDPKKIEMIDRQTPSGIFVDQRERWTGRSCRRAQGRDDTLHELGFAAAKAAGESKHVARSDILRNLSAERFGFLRAIGNERSHGEEVDS